MSAVNVARTLGDARPEGRSWRCRCPLHGGRSLLLRDGDGGQLLVKCWGGCAARDVLAELCRCGLLDRRASDYRPPFASAPREDEAARTTRALAIWRDARLIADTIAERYLTSRRILLGLPAEAFASLRFHPRCPHPNGVALPAMVALVEHLEHGPVAVHRTYLRADGSGKANVEPDKASLGPVGGGAVRLGMPRPGEWFAVAEGIETALAVATACSTPAWAALSAGGIKKLMLPRQATHVIIAADHDASGTGQRAARDAAQRWLAEGRRVRIAVPPEPDTDFADMLTVDTVAATVEARHVA
jgi:putative DNA primase/helicase